MAINTREKTIAANQDKRASLTERAERPERDYSTSEKQTINRWQFRADQTRVLYRQVQIELIISILVVIVTGATFWQTTPAALVIAWGAAIIFSVGGRSLFISGKKEETDDNDFEMWGRSYILAALFTGSCWGAMGVYSIFFASALHQFFSLFVLAGVSLTAFISMQSSPKTTAAFILPAMLPMTACLFFFQAGQTHYALGTLSFVFVALMLISSSSMRDLLMKSFKLGSHNTELIRKLVSARESADKSRHVVESTNSLLQEQIIERERAEERIRTSEQQLSSIFDSMQDTIYQTDIDGNIVWTTPSIKQLLGYTTKEIKGRNIREFYATTGDYEAFKQAMDTNYGRLQHFETRLQHNNGDILWISENSHYKYENGDIVGIEGTIRDITALKTAKEALFQEQERAQITLGSIGDGVITTDLNGDIDYMNTIAEQATGWKLDDARGVASKRVLKIVDEKTLTSPLDTVAHCIKNEKSANLSGHLLLIHRHRNQRLSVEVNASPIRNSDSAITGVVLVFHDVTELRGLAKKMSYQATHDSLTGLINRREFENRLKQALDNSRGEEVRHALCYMDLDNFKVVNDTCGHVAGDELLKQLTIKLRLELREADTLARLGGDEFGILLEGCSVENAHEPAENIRKLIEDFRFVWENKSFRISASIGLVPITADSGSLTDILSAADSACYVAKDQGRNRIHIYQPDDEALAERHGQMQWVQRIQDVLEHNRFRLFFQPIAKLDQQAPDAHMVHGEVLLRLLDENNEIVGPGSFMPSAERYFLMPAIDRWVVENTFRMLSLDQKAVSKKISTCAINLSGQSLSDERFMEFLVNSIKSSGIPPEILCFEITETAVIANLCNASKLISTLREMGCRFALDDFGVGLSSFSYLKNLAVDYLKLDGCFVRNMVNDSIDAAMVEAINNIGHTMGIKTIAEFVEDEATLNAVRKLGIDYAQGYVISRPIPIEIGLYGDKPIVIPPGPEEDIPVPLKAVSGRKK